MTKNKILASTGPEQNMTAYTLSTWKGRKLFQIRKTFKNKDGEMIFTKKGIAFTENSYSTFTKIINENQDIIGDWFEDKTTDEEALEKLATSTKNIHEASLKREKYETKSESIKTLLFYKVDRTKDGKEITFNTSHNFFKKHKLDDTNVAEIISDLLISLDQTLHLYDEDQQINAQDLIDDIKFTWSRTLSNYTR